MGIKWTRLDGAGRSLRKPRRYKKATFPKEMDMYFIYDDETGIDPNGTNMKGAMEGIQKFRG